MVINEKSRESWRETLDEVKKTTRKKGGEEKLSRNSRYNSKEKTN